MDRGFSLVEVLVATTLLTVALVGLAQLSVVSVHMNHGASLTTAASALASQKTAQLKTLTWVFDDAGVAVSDTTTDTAAVPEQPGGTGLTPSASIALTHNTPGYFDFVDAFGRNLGAGAAAPVGTAYIRRWSIDQLPGLDALVLQVLVCPARHVGDAGAVRSPEEARLVAVKLRKSG